MVHILTVSAISRATFGGMRRTTGWYIDRAFTHSFTASLSRIRSTFFRSLFYMCATRDKRMRLRFYWSNPKIHPFIVFWRRETFFAFASQRKRYFIRPRRTAQTVDGGKLIKCFGCGRANQSAVVDSSCSCCLCSSMPWKPYENIWRRRKNNNSKFTQFPNEESKEVGSRWRQPAVARNVI